LDGTGDGNTQRTLGILLERSEETLRLVRGMSSHEERLKSLEDWRMAQDTAATSQENRRERRRAGWRSWFQIWAGWVVAAGLEIARLVVALRHPYTGGAG
jgi:hypothetical protein